MYVLIKIHLPKVTKWEENRNSWKVAFPATNWGPHDPVGDLSAFAEVGAIIAPVIMHYRVAGGGQKPLDAARFRKFARFPVATDTVTALSCAIAQGTRATARPMGPSARLYPSSSEPPRIGLSLVFQVALYIGALER